MKYWNIQGQHQDLYNKYWETLVPDSGEADTPEGEALRAITRIYYDVYNNGEEQTDPRFGVVDHGILDVNLAGVFMDLGGGTDTYNTSIEGVGNDACWYLDPVGQDVDPAFHKGVGIDK